MVIGVMAYGINTGEEMNVHKVSPYFTKEQPRIIPGLFLLVNR